MPNKLTQIERNDELLSLLNNDWKIVDNRNAISKKFKSSFDTLVKNNKLLLTKFEYLYLSEND